MSNLPNAAATYALRKLWLRNPPLNASYSSPTHSPPKFFLQKSETGGIKGEESQGGRTQLPFWTTGEDHVSECSRMGMGGELCLNIVVADGAGSSSGGAQCRVFLCPPMPTPTHQERCLRAKHGTWKLLAVV